MRQHHEHVRPPKWVRPAAPDRPDRQSAAEILCEAIEQHRDSRWHGQVVTEPLDLTLYSAAVWYRTWQDHQDDADAPIVD